jgi:hypothetical protein
VPLSIAVTAPDKTGNLVLEYQMIKEGWYWFSQFADVNTSLTYVYAATYSVVNTPTSWGPNQTQTYIVTITNSGNQTWTAGGSYPVRLGVHFVSAGGGFGNSTVYTDQRINLSADLAPGASVPLSIAVTAPDKTGNLVLEYQMIKEGWFWFSQFADVNVVVR